MQRQSSLLAVGNIGVAQANTILWISDQAGNIGQVDVTAKSVVAGSVHSTGLGTNLTDIAFVGSSLFGTTYSGLYSINTGTGATTFLGSYNLGGGEMNALIGTGSGLMGASWLTQAIYNINPSNASTTTFATSPLYSTGDLAFHGSTLYESGENYWGTKYLANVTTGAVIGSLIAECLWIS